MLELGQGGREPPPPDELDGRAAEGREGGGVVGRERFSRFGLKIWMARE